MEQRRHVIVSGRVQGVWFRDSCRRRAEELGVSGWARNLPDGRVEAVFEGDADAVDAMIEWCQEGPPGAEVDTVMVSRGSPEGLDRFEVR